LAERKYWVILMAGQSLLSSLDKIPGKKKAFGKGKEGQSVYRQERTFKVEKKKNEKLS